jgi:hypothetical protein
VVLPDFFYYLLDANHKEAFSRQRSAFSFCLMMEAAFLLPTTSAVRKVWLKAAS